MIGKLVLAAITLLVQQDMVSAEFTMIPSTTTAAELWNPYTWFWPYAIASAESYRDYFSKAQKATNELYQQIYATNANPLITGNWGGASPVKKPAENASQNNSTQNNQNQNANNNNNQQEKPNETNQNENANNNNNNNNSNNQQEKPNETNQNENGGENPSGGDQTQTNGTNEA